MLFIFILNFAILSKTTADKLFLLLFIINNFSNAPNIKKNFTLTPVLEE